MEILTYIPGSPKLVNIITNDNGLSTFEYEYPEISHEYAKAQELGMTKAMDELLHKLVPGFPSKADCNLGVSWASK